MGHDEGIQMIDFSKPVRTKGDKMPVRILATDATTFDGKPIVGTYDGYVETWTAGGSYCNEPVASGMDLENIPAPGRIPEAIYYSPSLKATFGHPDGYHDLIKYVPESK